eukprot:TRINITY_DN10524_c0_g1_i2.p1 TRINITY_DN10524_c0_g1~~TRINITY_DN10524_c0_g1_i2.p1  ORF type:complete len:409 (+),score=47.26 TRINITY_DN10524_c0_g1_i2:81-1307(+)
MACEAEACPVCCQRYRDPQFLSACGHSFCRCCIEATQVPYCPVCRTPFKRAQDVRPNYALVRMMQESSAHPGTGVGPPSAPTTPFIEARQALIGVSAHEGTTPTSRMHAEPCLCFQAIACSVAGLSAQQSTVRRRCTQLDALRSASSEARADVPFGLAQLLSVEDQHVGVRMFLLDNSGSTQTYDGTYLDETGRKGPRMVSCTRWQEIQRMALKQAEWNAAFGTPCEFILLNPPTERRFAAFREGVDMVRIDPSQGDAATQLAALRTMLDKTLPRGATPLCERIMEIQYRLDQTYRHFGESGLKAVVVVATDGLPSDSFYNANRAKEEFVAALRELTRKQPVFLVIRLCTDEADVVEYYNKVDEEEELPLEVIDDLEAEAKEVAAQGNGWLIYSPTIHMIREGGTFCV